MPSLERRIESIEQARGRARASERPCKLLTLQGQGRALDEVSGLFCADLDGVRRPDETAEAFMHRMDIEASIVFEGRPLVIAIAEYPGDDHPGPDSIQYEALMQRSG
jgi:hypothetical protein